jgi:hypothetical protein
MSRDGGESQLKSLQNVDKSLLHKLKGVGIESISDLATTTASELLEDYYSNYDESARGMDFETISQLVLTAKQKLIDDGLLQAGVNDISSIYFSLSDEKSEAIKSDLLKQAVTNAKSKADIAASALGLNVIGVKSINIESINGFPPSPPEPLMAQESAGAAAATGQPPTPIIAGEQEVTSSVDVVFFIG